MKELKQGPEIPLFAIQFLDNRRKIVAVDNGPLLLHRVFIITAGQRNDCAINDSGKY